MSVHVFDDLFSPSVLRAAEATWPGPTWPWWHRYNNGVANKFGSMDRDRIPSGCLALLDQMAAVVGNDTLRRTDSFIDYDLHAAGMHMIPPGGFLGRHKDAESHPIRKWTRTHSVVLFLNEKWLPEWGGELRIEGFDDVPPKFGRLVIFETAGTWHQVMHTSSNSDYRRTLALFAWEYCDSASGNSYAIFSDEQPSTSHGHVKSQ